MCSFKLIAYTHLQKSTNNVLIVFVIHLLILIEELVHLLDVFITLVSCTFHIFNPLIE